MPNADATVGQTAKKFQNHPMDTQGGSTGPEPRCMRRQQAINGYFTCARGRLLTPKEEMQRVARTEIRTAGTAPTGTFGRRGLRR
ncbi:hypothetical protein PSP6_180035 [Paraburkholderia tropica]|nr:hypothetical protein PSP6_180035 [Paraburkholderia tropica]